MSVVHKIGHMQETKPMSQNYEQKESNIYPFCLYPCDRNLGEAEPTWEVPTSSANAAMQVLPMQSEAVQDSSPGDGDDLLSCWNSHSLWPKLLIFLGAPETWIF